MKTETAITIIEAILIGIAGLLVTWGSGSLAYGFATCAALIVLTPRGPLS